MTYLCVCRHCKTEFRSKFKHTRFCSKKCGKRIWDIENIEHKRKYEREKLQKNEALKKYRQLQSLKFRLKKYFNLTLEQYEMILDQQNHSCAICSTHIDEFDKRLAVDHSHTSGEIRGLLCLDCNQKLIGPHEKPEIFDRAAEYLRSARTGLFVPKEFTKGMNK